jgi:hypothetical protein
MRKFGIRSFFTTMPDFEKKQKSRPSFQNFDPAARRRAGGRPDPVFSKNARIFFGVVKIIGGKWGIKPLFCLNTKRSESFGVDITRHSLFGASNLAAEARREGRPSQLRKINKDRYVPRREFTKNGNRP